MVFDSIFLQRFIIFLLLVFIVLSLVKRFFKFACFCLSILCFMQIGYSLGQGPINDKIPFNNYFKYDVIKSITSIWNETDKEELEKNISNSINKGWEVSDEILDKYNNLDKEELKNKASVGIAVGKGITDAIIDKYTNDNTEQKNEEIKDAPIDLEARLKTLQ